MTNENAFVLAGPKFPVWACNCGSANNYACRIKCRCGRNAPHRIVHAAREAAKRFPVAPAPSYPRTVGGAWAKGAPENKRDIEIASLRSEIDLLRKQQGQQPPTVPENDKEGPNIAMLVSAVDRLEKAMGVEHELVLSAKKELENARKKRDESKTIKNRILDTAEKAGKRRKVEEAA